jgi:hypothetical protein
VRRPPVAPPPAVDFGPGGLDGGFGPQGGGGFGPTSTGSHTNLGPADPLPTETPETPETPTPKPEEAKSRPSFLLEPEPHENFGSDAVTAPPVIGE